jgi:hypothetical protein
MHRRFDGEPGVAAAVAEHLRFEASAYRLQPGSPLVEAPDASRRSSTIDPSVIGHSVAAQTPRPRSRELLAHQSRHRPACTRCKLRRWAETSRVRRRNPDADLMFVGEAPGADEDIQGSRSSAAPGSS